MATNYQLPVVDVLKTAWDKTDGAKGTIWACVGISFLIQIFFLFLAKLFAGASLLAFIVEIIGGIIAGLISVGIIYICIKRIRGEAITYKMMWTVFKKPIVFNVIAYVIILNLVVLIPLILLGIIFGESPLLLLSLAVIFIMVRLMPGAGLVVDQNINALDAVKMSYRMTTGNTWRLILYVILSFIVMTISVIPFGIGLIWTLPWAHMSFAEVYKRFALDNNIA